MVDRMLVAINKGYWQADPAVKAKLEQVNQEVIAKAGVACNKDTCSSPEITKLAEQQDAAKLPKPPRRAHKPSHRQPPPLNHRRQVRVSNRHPLNSRLKLKPKPRRTPTSRLKATRWKRRKSPTTKASSNRR